MDYKGSAQGPPSLELDPAAWETGPDFEAAEKNQIMIGQCFAELAEASARFSENIGEPKVAQLKATIENLTDLTRCVNHNERFSEVVHSLPLAGDCVRFLQATLEKSESAAIFRAVFPEFLNFLHELSVVVLFQGEMYFEVFRLLLDCVEFDPRYSLRILTVLNSLAHDAKTSIDCALPVLFKHGSIGRLLNMLKVLVGDVKTTIVIILSRIIQSHKKELDPSNLEVLRDIAVLIMTELGGSKSIQIDSAVLELLREMMMVCPDLWRVILGHEFMIRLMDIPRCDSPNTLFAFCLLNRILVELDPADLPGVIPEYLNFGNLRNIILYGKTDRDVIETLRFSAQFISKYRSGAISLYFENGIYHEIIQKLVANAWRYASQLEAVQLFIVSIAVSGIDHKINFFYLDGLVPRLIEFLADTEEPDIAKSVLESLQDMNTALSEHGRQAELSDLLKKCDAFELFNQMEVCVDEVEQLLRALP